MAKKSLLLVDDETEFVVTLSERLALRNFDSSCVFSGDDALQRITARKPDVMVLDLKMPGTDGMEILRQVRKNHPDIQVIILTGHGSEKDERDARRLGAFEYLNKPVDIETLTEHIRRAYDHKTNAAAAEP